MKKFKVIIDVDPGIDDVTALFYLLNDPRYEIELITVARGNIALKNAVRNACHVMDLLHKNVPIVAGYEKRFSSSTEDATFLHTAEGMGGYHPPKKTLTQPLQQDCADAMYDVLKKYPHQVYILMITPHTNLAYLLTKHPDARDLVKGIVMESGAPNGIKANPNYCSFNIRVDAPAFKHTIDANLPTVMIPSGIGRDEAYLTEEHVERMKNTNDVGLFMAKTFETYWEPNYSDRRIACNDLAAVFYLTRPHLFKFKRAKISVDTQTGKVTADYTHKGNFKVAQKLKRDRFLKLVFKKLEEMSDIKIPEIHKPEYSAPEFHETFETISRKPSAKKVKTGKKAGKTMATNHKNASVTKQKTDAKTTTNKTKSTAKATKTAARKTAIAKTSATKSSAKLATDATNTANASSATKVHEKTTAKISRAKKNSTVNKKSSTKTTATKTQTATEKSTGKGKTTKAATPKQNSSTKLHTSTAKTASTKSRKTKVAGTAGRKQTQK